MAAAHTSGSQCPLVVPLLSTWSWLVTFMLQKGTLGLAWTSVLDVYIPSQELFWLGSMRMLAAPQMCL